MNKLLLILIFLFPAFISAQSDFDQFRAHKFFVEGYNLYKDRNFSAAIGAFNQCILVNPNHPDVYRFRGESYMGMQAYDLALGDFILALRKSPGDFELYNRRGMTYAKLDQFEEAAADFRRALEINPSYEAAKANLGYIQDKISTSPIAEGPGQSPDFEFDQPSPTETISSTDPFPEMGVESAPRELIYDHPPVRQKPNPYVTIEEVLVTQTSTLVRIQIAAPSRDPVPFAIYKDPAKAFYITDRLMRQKYTLLDVKDIEWGRKLQVRAGQTAVFTLEFQPLPSDVNIIHIRQGKNPTEDSWNFYDIELINGRPGY